MTVVIAILAVLFAAGAAVVTIFGSDDEESNSWRLPVVISLALSAISSFLAIISQCLVWK